MLRVRARATQNDHPLSFDDNRPRTNRARGGLSLIVGAKRADRPSIGEVRPAGRPGAFTRPERQTLRAVLLLAGSIAFPSTLAAEEIQGFPYVIDGDTFSFRDHQGKKSSVRFSVIDAPEKAQQCEDQTGACYPCGQDARNTLAHLVNANRSGIAQSQVRCELLSGSQLYGRSVGVCYRGDVNLNVALVQTGFAIVVSRYLKQQPALKAQFKAAELSAKNQKIGVWSGKSLNPYLWRKGQRLNCE